MVESMNQPPNTNIQISNNTHQLIPVIGMHSSPLKYIPSSNVPSSLHTQRHNFSSSLLPPQLFIQANQPSPFFNHANNLLQSFSNSNWMNKEKSILNNSNNSNENPTNPLTSLRFPLSEAPTELIQRLTMRQASSHIRVQTKSTLLDNYSEINNKFGLLEQPNDVQRKSYGKENRCILPNPLVVCLKKSSQISSNNNISNSMPGLINHLGIITPSPHMTIDPDIGDKIVEGTVSVRLVDEDGYELPPQRQKLLESVVGGLVHPLDDGNTASFSIKILHTSEGHYFRLLFVVIYRVKGEPKPIEEKIISRPFVVYSKKHSSKSRTEKKELNSK